MNRTRLLSGMIGGLGAVLAVAACGSNSPPVAVGSINDQEMFVTDSLLITNLGRYFEDPDGDDLAFSSESSDEELLTVTVTLDAFKGVPQGDRNTATVTVAASDPDGETAEQVFSVTVVNRNPVATRGFPSLVIKTGASDTVQLDAIFNDPDGDALDYTAEPRGSGVTVTVSGDTLVVVAGEVPGEAGVLVNASDEYGGQVALTGSVTVETGPNLTGVWKGSFPSPPVTVEVTLDLKDDDTDLSGTLEFRILVVVMTGDVTGEFNHPDVEFESTGTITATFAGTVSGDEMTGTLTWEGEEFSLSLSR